MIGKVVRVEDSEVGVEIAQNVTVKVVKSMIAEVRTRGEPAPANDSQVLSQARPHRPCSTLSRWKIFLVVGLGASSACSSPCPTCCRTALLAQCRASCRTSG